MTEHGHLATLRVPPSGIPAPGPEPFPDGQPDVIIRPMLTLTHAIDLFLGDLARSGYSNRTRDTYRRILDKLDDHQPTDTDVAHITTDDLRRFLDRWNRRAPGTRAHTYSVLSSFFRWLYLNEKIKRNPLDRLGRPKRIPAEDLDVLTVDAADIPRLLAAAATWPERLCVATLAYLGPRRHATALIRMGDYDRARQRLRFREKGGKTIWKPVPRELAQLIEAAIAAGAYGPVGEGFRDAYLVPAEGPLSRKDYRDDRVIWRIVKRVAARAGVDAHVHALRAAFAVYYLERNPDDLLGLKELLGHHSLNTTLVYLRRLNRQAAMERVRALSWTATSSESGAAWLSESPPTALAASPAVGAGGFEPPYASVQGPERPDSQQPADDLAGSLNERAREAADRARERVDT